MAVTQKEERQELLRAMAEVDVYYMEVPPGRILDQLGRRGIEMNYVVMDMGTSKVLIAKIDEKED